MGEKCDLYDDCTFIKEFAKHKWVIKHKLVKRYCENKVKSLKCFRKHVWKYSNSDDDTPPEQLQSYLMPNGDDVPNLGKKYWLSHY